MLKVIEENGKYLVKQVDENGNSLGLVKGVEFSREKDADTYCEEHDSEVEENSKKKGKKAEAEEE